MTKMMNLRNAGKMWREACGGNTTALEAKLRELGYTDVQFFGDSVTFVKYKNFTKLVARYNCTFVHAYNEGRLADYLLIELLEGKWDKLLFDPKMGFSAYLGYVEADSWTWKSLISQPENVERDNRLRVVIAPERRFGFGKTCFGQSWYANGSNLTDYYCRKNWRAYHVMRIANAVQPALS